MPILSKVNQGTMRFVVWVGQLRKGRAKTADLGILTKSPRHCFSTSDSSFRLEESRILIMALLFPSQVITTHCTPVSSYVK